MWDRLSKRIYLIHSDQVVISSSPTEHLRFSSHVWGVYRSVRDLYSEIERRSSSAKHKTVPGPDQNLWRPYGLEWEGPPLQIEK